ncbi:hypothetical protein [Bradyrhizobium genosp. P]|uniref:hypothetical protein n=1 Tax=Bradyrhizobium genosp. P TaxID=83641 RepID=UPI003CF01070
MSIADLGHGPRLLHRLTRFNFGGIVSPLLFGWFMEQHMPHRVFGASVVFMVLTVLLALISSASRKRPVSG